MYLICDNYADFGFVPMTNEKWLRVADQTIKHSKRLEPNIPGSVGNNRRSLIANYFNRNADKDLSSSLTFLPKTYKDGNKTRKVNTGFADISSTGDLDDSIMRLSLLGDKRPSHNFLKKAKRDVYIHNETTPSKMENLKHTVNLLIGNPKSVQDKRFKGATKALGSHLASKKIPDWDSIEMHSINPSTSKLYNKYLGRPEDKDTFLMREVRNRKRVE